MSLTADQNKNVNITIDGISLTVPEGTRILEAAKMTNIYIPTLCEHPDLCKRGLCRICVVECNGMSKLFAACCNEVWDGMRIVTKNKRIAKIRRTIVELILAYHPQDCLSCIRNKNCELQKLSEGYAVFNFPFKNEGRINPPQIENETIVHEMRKCVKCGRCVEMCQEIMQIRAINTSYRSHKFIISTPYRQALRDSSCVFCGQCVKVCPASAIYEHDQSMEVMECLAAATIINSKTITQVSPALAPALEHAYAFSAGTITTGKIITALRLLGFNKIYDASAITNAVNAEICMEIQKRKTNLPLISGCSEGMSLFIKNFYPDLTGYLTTIKSPRQYFNSIIKPAYFKEYTANMKEWEKPVKVTSVSFVPCIGQKYTAEHDNNDFALTAPELMRMLKLSGIIIETLKEESFDTIEINAPKHNISVKKITVNGFADARNVMETIRRGECNAEWVEVLSCPDECYYTNLHKLQPRT
jgi:iron only hydrogenase large subunit-like protein